MGASGGDSVEINRLKSLLFEPEAHRLEAAEAKIRGLQDWVGDAPHLETATAHILVEAFRKAEVSRHRELASALAPVIVAAIRSEIQNSRDIMVEALYPLTGRLVSAAVASAFRDLVASINERMDALLSANQWRLRFRSVATGRPVAEIALAEAQRASYRRILLFERGTGKVLAHWSRDGSREDNPELVGGMIAAISEFAQNVLSQQHGELRNLDLGADQVYLRASGRVILAGQLKGALTQADKRRIDAEFIEFIGRHERGEPVDSDELAALGARTLGDRTAARPKGRGRGLVLAAIALTLIGYGLYGPVVRWIKDREIRGAFAAAEANAPELAGWPVSVVVDGKKKTATLTGLASSAPAVEAVLQAVTSAAAPYATSSQVRIVVESRDAEAARVEGADRSRKLESRVDSLARDDAKRVADAAEADAVALEAASAEGRGQAERQFKDLHALVESQNARLDDLKARVEADRNRLEAVDASASRALPAEEHARDLADLKSSGDAERLRARVALTARLNSLGAALEDLRRGQTDLSAARIEIEAKNASELERQMRAVGSRIADFGATAAKALDEKTTDLTLRLDSLNRSGDDLRAALNAQSEGSKRSVETVGAAAQNALELGLAGAVAAQAKAASETEKHIKAVEARIADSDAAAAKALSRSGDDLRAALAAQSERSKREIVAVAATTRSALEAEIAGAVAAEAKDLAEIGDHIKAIDVRLAAFDAAAKSIAAKATDLTGRVDALSRSGEDLRAALAAESERSRREDAAAQQASASGIAAVVAAQVKAAAEIGDQIKTIETRIADSGAAAAKALSESTTGLTVRLEALSRSGDDLRMASASENERTKRAVEAVGIDARSALDSRVAEVSAVHAKAFTDLNAALADARKAVDARLAALALAGAKTAADLNGELSEAKKSVEASQARMGKIETAFAAVDPVRLKTLQVLSDSVIFFALRDAPIDAAVADKVAAEVAAALLVSGTGVRVIGYSDDVGSVGTANFETSKARAAKVAKMLGDHGVPSDRIVAVGRGAGQAIVDPTAERSALNRRVVFEPLFAGEPTR